MRVPFFVTFDFTGGGRRGWLYTESSSRGRRGGAGAAPAGRPRGPRASRLSTLATVRRSTPRRRSPRRSPLAASPLLPPPLCLAAPFRDCEHSVSMIRSVCPYLSLQPAVLHVLSVCIFSCSWRRFRRCAERHFFLRKCISCARKPQHFLRAPPPAARTQDPSLDAPPRRSGPPVPAPSAADVVRAQL